jgi:hypothetical protein
MDFDITDQQLIRNIAFLRCWRKNGSTMEQYISYLQISNKPVIHLGEKYYTTFSLKLARLIKTCLMKPIVKSM